MKFQRRFEDIEFLEGAVRMLELSHAEFDQVMAIENENDQVIELIYLGLEEKPDSKGEIYHWPVSVINQLSASALRLNGLTEGN